MQNFTNTWKTVKLSDVTDYINRGIPPVYTQDGAGTIVVNQKCVRNDQVSFGAARLTDESARQVPQDKLLQPYDILVNSTGTGTVGRVGQIMDLTQRATVDSHVTIVRPRKDEINPTYLGVWLKAKQDELEVLAEGSSNQVELSRDKISNLKVILPSIKTQQKIADILLSVDQTIARTNQIIQKTIKLKEGIVQQIFNSRTWKSSSLGDVLDLVIDHRGLTPKKLGGDWSVNGIPALSAMNVKNGKIVNHDQIRFVDETLYKRWMPKEIQEGDILLTSEAPLGEAYIVKNGDRYCLSQRLYALRPNVSKIVTDFLYYFITSNLGERLLEDRSTGTTAKGIRQSELIKVIIKYPDIQEQKRIGLMLSTIDRKLDFYSQEFRKLQTLKKGLIQDIFNQKVQI